MKLICAGLGKTGTTSLHEALDEFGYSVHDFPEHYAIHYEEYYKIVKVGWTKEVFQAMYENVDATLDGPAYYFWDDILEAFPDAKVILTVRDSDEIWFKSMEKQIKTLDENPFWFYNRSSSWQHFWRFIVDLSMVAFGKKPWKDYNPKDPIPNMVYKQVYRRHIAYVINTCPKDKLLVFNCKEGWEPLCKFIGEEVPNKPFPHANPNSQLTTDIWQLPAFKRAKKEALISYSIIVLVGGLATVQIARMGWIQRLFRWFI